MKDTLNIGDTVSWRGAWGTEPAEEAKVSDMWITKNPREKYGKQVQDASWDMVKQNRVVVDLENGHWAYGEQLSQLPQEGEEI